MTKQEFLNELDELVEADPGTLTGTETLRDLEGWNSLTVMGFIALIDEKFGTSVPANRIAEAKTVNDLIDLLGNRVNA
jgi:acyl carrier protein